MKEAAIHDGDTRSKLLDAAFSEIYVHGYHGAATAAILRSAGVPKGSMYHFFDSKKTLALAVLRERIIPRMETFFDFQTCEGETLMESMERIFEKMAGHELLIANGCPMHRLMVEMAPLDEAFESVLADQYEHFIARISETFAAAIERGEMRAFDTDALARFFITSTWGVLSLPPSHSSIAAFRTHTRYLLDLLKNYRNSK